MTIPTASERTGPIRVLLVDDMPLFRRAIAQLIDAQPDLQVVGQAGNGLEGVELARSLAPDLVVMDMEMPVMTGIEAAALILDQLPAIKVIMLTVCDDDERLLRCIRMGVHGYLLKDLHPDDLYAMLRSAARDETPVSPQLVGRLLAELRGGGVRHTTVDPAPAEAAPQLSHRELEILQLVARGLSNREIGRTVSITEGTVKNHVHNALRKLGLDNRSQAAAYMVRAGYAAPDHSAGRD